MAWVNRSLPWYVVQAMPATAAQPGEPNPAVFVEQCARFRQPVQLHQDRPCAGLSAEAMSGVCLVRSDALHAIRQHYVYPNWSICRFASPSRGDYAADLIFEIDAHVKGIPAWFLDHAFYEPIVRAAVTVGSRLLTYLITNLDIEPKYVTTCVTRMGCRVTVDWRAFGPQRLWALLAIVRWVESKVFSVNELPELARRLRQDVLVQAARLDHNRGEVFAPLDPSKVTAEVKVDGSIYARSDLPRIDPEHGHNNWKGPFIRPIGALHSGSSILNMFCRTTPVPHENFVADQAAWLTRVSRTSNFKSWRGPSILDHEFPRLFSEIWRQPEGRHPLGDHLIEDAPRPAEHLIRLFESADDLQDELPEDAADEISIVRRKALGSNLRSLGEVQAELGPDAVDKIIASLKKVRFQRGDRVRAVCPFCDKEPESLTVHTREGHAHCFRCNKGFSLADLAIKLGRRDLVQWQRHSSSPIQRVPVDSLPPTADVAKWGPDAVVAAPDFETLEEARTAQRRFLDACLFKRDEWDLLVLRGPTGIGKTYGAIEAIGKAGLTSRGLFARGEAREPYTAGLSPSRVIDGRRPENCANFRRISEARDRLIPEWTICEACPHRDGCPYLAQFTDIKGVHLALLHAHAPHLQGRRLDNGAEITLVDENPWERCIEQVDLDTKELALFRCDLDVEADLDGTVGLDSVIAWRSPSEAIERLLVALTNLLGSDSVIEAEAASTGASEAAKHSEWTRHGCVADRDLTRLLFGRGSNLAKALLDLTELDYEAVEANATWLACLGDPRLRKPPKRILRELCSGLMAAWTSHVTDKPQTLPLLVHRDLHSTGWLLRLTRRLVINAGQTILLSSTVRPEQVRLAFGTELRVLVYEPRVRQRERRTLIADRSYSLTQLTKKEGQGLRERLFETVKKLVDAEHARTGLPVAIIGRSRLMNEWNRFSLGDAAKPFRMPWKPGCRDDQDDKLRTLTLPLGYVSGYAGGVVGSNRFAVEVLSGDGSSTVTRFVRSLIILGHLLPPLGQVALSLRGAYAGEKETFTTEIPGIGSLPLERNVIVDWTPTHRVVPLQEPEVETVLVTKNMLGFVGDRANELLHASLEAEFIQIAGRMRGSIPDPFEPKIEPKLWIFAGVGFGSDFPVDEVLGLEDVRERFGLDVRSTDDASSAHRPVGSSRKSLGDQIFRRWRKDGTRAAIRWLVLGLQKRGDVSFNNGIILRKLVRQHVEDAGLPWRDEHDELLTEVVRTARGLPAREHPVKSL